VSHPRYFVPHAASPAEAVQPDPAAVVHAMDAFRLQAGYVGEQEWIVCTDIAGNVHVLPASEREHLPASTKAQLTHHELASGRTPRRISASELFLFLVELVEHPTDAEGANDPVYLYGTLMGPWPSASPMRVPGQLTVTRGDLLAGLVQGAPDAFQYVQDPESKTAPRSYHALLPGDRAERIAEGRGLVLAYPAVPPELQAHNVANDPLVATILREALDQLQEYAREHGGPKAIAEMEVPVPSRLMAIAELESRGYEVKGDMATLRRNHPGLVNRLAEWLRAEKVKVPREATTPEFLELARRALEVLPGWPSDTERALRALVRPGNGAPPKPGFIPPVAAAQPLPTQRVIPPRPPPSPARPNDWMQDFLDAHTPPGGKKKAKLTRASEVTPPPRRAISTPKQASSSKDWMGDFTPGPSAPPEHKPPSPSTPPGPKRREPSAPAGNPAKKPDWMSDFED
jgi:hypothetical protein